MSPAAPEGNAQARRTADAVARRSYGKLVAFLAARTRDVAGAEDALWSMQAVVGLPAGRVAELARVRVPKAVIFGADDDVFSRRSPFETARRIGAPSPVIIPGARHLSLISHPRQVADAVLATAP